VGVRNHIAVIPSVFCAAKTAEMIAKGIEGGVVLRHPVGCGQVGLDFEFTARTLTAMGNHPNVAAVVVVGLGCERFKAAELYEGIRKTGKPVGMVVIQEDGGTVPTVEKGIRIGQEFARQENGRPRVECDISELTVALKCGGSDATSGLSSNPTLGAMSDLLVKKYGGSTILTELNELLSTEHMLAERAVNKEVADKIYAAVYEVEERLRSHCDDRFPGRNALMSPGNFTGGISSIVEKALGGYEKGGSAPITDVIEYSIPPEPGKKGLFLMNSDSHDGECVTGMVGCGAQIVAFTTGRGNPTGFPIAPVIKVTGNESTYKKMQDNFDFDASGVIAHGASIEDLGKDLFDLVVRVANGELTAAERLAGDELFCVGRR